MPEPTIKNQSVKQRNWLLAIAVLSLIAFPLVFVRGAFNGSDNQAEKVIQEINPTYEPWFKPFFEPASGEIESFLFAVQAALGAGVVGYAIGFYQGRSQKPGDHSQK